MNKMLDENIHIVEQNHILMKNILFALTIGMLIVSGSFIGCQSPSEKKESAEKDVQEAQEDLREAQKEVADSLHRAATAEEYEAFKADAQAKIKKNETRIAELRVKKSKPGKVLDEYYESDGEARHYAADMIKL